MGTTGMTGGSGTFAYAWASSLGTTGPTGPGIAAPTSNNNVGSARCIGVFEGTQGQLVNSGVINDAQFTVRGGLPPVGNPAYLASDQDDGGTGAGKLTATAPIVGVLAEVGVVEDNSNYYATGRCKIQLELQRIVILPQFTSPPNLPGLKTWLRSDLGIVLSTNKVTTWNDQSGNANNATQNTNANRPTYNSVDAAYAGKPSLSFDGATSFMNLVTSLAGNQPYTVYIVGQSSGGGARQEFFADATNNGCIFISTGVATNWSLSNGASLTATGPYANTVGQPTAFCGVANSQNVNNASSFLYINSSSVAAAGPGNSGSNNPQGQETIGASTSGTANFLNGKIVEIIAYTGAHSPAQIAQVFNYISQRYKLPYVA